MARSFDADLAADRARVLEIFAVSRETTERLDRFVALLLDWQRTTNLIAASTVSFLWSRHIGDSLQLLELPQSANTPQPRQAVQPDGSKPCTWVDLGSGGGFPGMVIACALAETETLHLSPEGRGEREAAGEGGSGDTVVDENEAVAGRATVHLIESNAKKAAFLREAARETGAPAIIHAERIETAGPLLRLAADVITARALAPLDRLCRLIAPILKKGAQALLMKGQDLEAELTIATKYWNIDYDIVPSRSSPSGRIMIVRALSPKR